MHGQEAFEYTDSMPTWKTVQSKKNIRKKTKLALMVLGIILGILLLGWVFRFTQTLFSPWQASEGSRNYAWGGEFNINILLASKDIALLSFNPTDQKITVVRIADQTLMDVPREFGKWQARSVSSLGGNKLLKETLGAFFGLPVDGYLRFEGKLSDKNTQEIVESIKQNPFDIFSLLPNIKTDLTLWELIKLRFEIANVRFDKIKYVDLEELGLLEEDQLADGTPIFTFDPVKIDSFSMQLLEPKIQLENKTIAIYNATDQPGLAQKAARIIENLGGNVIITSNSGEKLGRTKVIGEKSQTLTRLLQVFNAEVSEVGIESRAQISIMLGEDYFSSQ